MGEEQLYLKPLFMNYWREIVPRVRTLFYCFLSFFLSFFPPSILHPPALAIEMAPHILWLIDQPEVNVILHVDYFMWECQTQLVRQAKWLLFEVE